MFLFAGLYVQEPVALIFAGILALIAIGLIFSGRSNMKKQKRMLDTDTSRCDKLREGFAEVKGKARSAGTMLESPLSKARCIYYQFKVEEHVQRGKSSYWR